MIHTMENKPLDTAKPFDLIVIGAGSGGLNVASFMNAIGLRVLLIDKSDEHIGGDCLNTGCVPSKAFIHVARAHRAAREASHYGMSLGGEVDLGAVMDHVVKAQEIIREHENAEYFRSKGMTVVLGEASFVSSHSVRVGEREYRGKKIVIATGSRPRSIDIPGVADVAREGRLYTNENIFSCRTLPKKLLVIGTGPIGIELGQAFLHLGSQVTFVGQDAGILPREDAAVSEILRTRLIEEGAQFHLSAKPVRFEGGNSLIVEDQTTHAPTAIGFDAVLVSIGRALNTESLALTKAGIAQNDRGGIVVDPYLRTSQKHIVVCGDVAGLHQFTHAAELHAGLIIRNLLNPLFKKKLTTDALSWVTYTTPEIATYGVSERDLSARGIPHTVLESSFQDDDRAITDDARNGYTKMYVHAKTKHILGGTMIAPNAGEIVQELILALGSRITTADIFNKIYPYPVASRINKRLVVDANRERLTTRVKSLLRLFFSLTR
jgi:pyruvate/2-oxoglutarate dehydrogenase complex dihydrolipoamide dehydrogenase (E3) component